ncbi:MAG TPA: hypothetical protein VHA11_11965 [Bryobacteraceae bacterium]|nr:hypothetical protein [Bryobacteraceae bacterium]
MGIVISPYSSCHAAAIREFNVRLASVSAYREFQLPEEPAPPGDGRRLCESYYLALSGGVVRGGYILNRQEFWFRGEARRVAHYRLPLSEGVLDRTYSGVAMQMLRAALRAEPLLFALGMGGAENALPRLLRAMGWSIYAVPFYFRVTHPGRMLRELPRLRASRAGRLAAAAARLSGAAWLGIGAAQALRRRPVRGVTAEPVRAFDAWADALWERSHYRYRMLAARDSGALNALYPRADERFHRLCVSREGAVAGWALVLDTAMRDNRHFGNLRVGTIADCLALPEDAPAVVGAAARWLEQRGVDLIVSNQAHAAWRRALERAGFLRGPSNFLFAASRDLARLLDPFETAVTEIHINRGDGDGPIHL